MKILIAGASGLVGSALMGELRRAGQKVNALVRERSQATGGDVFWNPAGGQLDAAALAEADAVINLAGESIAGGRWTARRKESILSSRVSGTRTLALALAKLPPKPRTLVNASAIGYYGNRSDELLDESSGPGAGDFLSAVCRAWEGATEPAAQAGVRVALARFGVILSRKGGALRKMLLPFQLGLGGRIGAGQQYMSWIALDDVVRAIIHILQTQAIAGPVNVVAPNPVTNLEYTKTLGRVLSRPTIFPMPAFAARIAFGQMADELLLASQRVVPGKLQSSEFQFLVPTLEPALQHVLAH